MVKPALNITSRCNNDCQMCPFRQGTKTDEKDMSWEQFIEIMDKLEADAVMLFNKGEPFMHPKIYEMIEYSRFPVIISTNAVLVDTKRLPYEKIQTLCVSIPAGNRETYKQITKRDQFDLVIQKAKEMEERAVNEFYVKMVKQQENEGQEEELKRIFKMVHVVDDSNQPNTHNYTDCTQPDITPVYTSSGKKVVCCRDAKEEYDWNKYYNQAKRRELDICQKCNIR